MAKFLGLQYPLLKTPRGIMAQKSGVDQIKADVLQLLLTNPGERVMMPTFGTPLRRLIFEQNDATLEAAAKQMIASAILEWEPRIVVQNIEVTSNFASSDLHSDDSGDEQPAILGIKIEFVDPDNIAQVEKIEMQLPLGG
jgi:phage baseplate assembly protein W